MANAVAAGAQEASALVELLPASEFGTGVMFAESAGMN